VAAGGCIFLTRRPIKFQSMICRYDRQNDIKNEPLVAERLKRK